MPLYNFNKAVEVTRTKHSQAGGGIAIVPRTDCEIIDYETTDYSVTALIRLPNSNDGYLSVTSVYIPPASSKYVKYGYGEILESVMYTTR